MTAFEWINHQEADKKIQISETQLTQEEINTLQESYIKDANVIKEKSIDDRWKLKTFSIETNNDNGLSLKQGKDDGLTFGIHGEVEFKKWENKKITLSAWINSFTENPEYIQQDGWRIWMRDWEWKSARVDTWYIEWMYTEESSIWDNVDIKYGGWAWLWYTWNLWGQSIQNSWHRGLWKGTMEKWSEYTVHADYENFKNPYAYAKWIVEAQYNLNDTFYLKTEAQAQLSLYNQAANTMSGKIGAWFDTKYIRVEWWMEWYYHTWDQSSIVQDFYDKWKNTGLYWEVALWSKNGFQVVWKASDRHGWQWSVWIKLDF